MLQAGDWRLLRRLDPEETAEVFFARKGEQLAWVRRVLPSLIRNKPTVAAFLDEAAITRHLRHPNLLRLLDSGEAEEAPFLAFEFLFGTSLDRLVEAEARRGGAIPQAVALRFALDALAGLEAVHLAADERGNPLDLIHRDLRPPHIRLGFLGQTKLTGFGSASHRSRTQPTEFGSLQGRVSYAAPEALGGAFGVGSDLFSFGVVLYELLTLTRPFDRQSEFHTLKAIREEEPTPASSVRPGLPADLDQIVSRALAKKPSDRFPSAAAFRKAIEGIGQRVGMASEREAGDYLRRLLTPNLRAPTAGVEGFPLASILAEMGVAGIGDEPEEGMLATNTDPSRVLFGGEPLLVQTTIPNPLPSPIEAPEPVRAPTVVERRPDPKPLAANPLPPEAPPPPEVPAFVPLSPTTQAPPEPAGNRKLEVAPSAEIPESKVELPPARGRLPPGAAVANATRRPRFRGDAERGVPLWVRVLIVGSFGLAAIATLRVTHPLSTPNLESLATLSRGVSGATSESESTPGGESAANTPLAPSPIVPERRPFQPEALRKPLPPVIEPMPDSRSIGSGTIVVESNPPASVRLDESARGTTPITLRASPGPHSLTVEGPQGQVKRFRVEVATGKQVRKVVNFPFIPPQPSPTHWP